MQEKCNTFPAAFSRYWHCTSSPCSALLYPTHPAVPSRSHHSRAQTTRKGTFLHFKPSACLALALLTVAIAAPASHAQTYSAAGDFSTTNNPTSTWSYGYEVGSGVFIPYSKEGNFNNIDYWYLPGTGLPDVGKNNTPVNQVFLDPGRMMFHPGNSQALANYSSVVRWTAPAAGAYTFSTGFTGVDTRGLKVSVAVARNGASVFSSDLTGLGSQLSFSPTYVLAANDTIDYVVSNHFNAATGLYDNIGDKNFVQLDATIRAAPVPEASSVVSLGLLLLLGLGGIAVSRRRKTGAAR